MWGGRFADSPDAVMEEINASIDFDRHLYRQDIAASKAHAAMLAKQGIITADDAAQITQGLDTILSEIEGGKFTLQSRARGHPHERGEPARRADRAGRRPAAYRALAQRPGGDRFPALGARRPSTRIDDALAAYQHALAEKALAHAATVMPGFTHLQTAQPVTFGHHLLAYVEMAARDRGRFADARARLNECPLGAAALAGTSFPINRDMTAKALGFDAADGEFARCGLRPRFRAGDAVGGRDHRGASVAFRRGDRDLELAAERASAAVGPVHHRLLDHAAEAQSGRRRTGARQGRPHRRRAHGAAGGDEGTAARLSEGHAGGQGRRHGRALAR